MSVGAAPPAGTARDVRELRSPPYPLRCRPHYHLPCTLPLVHLPHHLLTSSSLRWLIRLCLCPGRYSYIITLSPSLQTPTSRASLLLLVQRIPVAAAAEVTRLYHLALRFRDSSMHTVLRLCSTDSYCSDRQTFVAGGCGSSDRVGYSSSGRLFYPYSSSFLIFYLHLCISYVVHEFDTVGVLDAIKGVDVILV